VSSIIKATHADLSNVVIFLPSLPISLPFISSEGIGIRVVVTSLVTSQAYCCIDFRIISLAISFFSSSIFFLYFVIISTQSSENLSFICFKNISLASFSDSFAISDNFQSSSIFLFSSSSFCSLKLSSL
jgi:hypothetical protein